MILITAALASAPFSVYSNAHKNRTKNPVFYSRIFCPLKNQKIYQSTESYLIFLAISTTSIILISPSRLTSAISVSGNIYGNSKMSEVEIYC